MEWLVTRFPSKPIERCMYCLHSKRNHTVAGQVGRCVLEGCNCPAFVPEVEPLGVPGLLARFFFVGQPLAEQTP